MSETPLLLEPDDRPPPPRWPGEIVVEAECEDLFDNLATELMLSAIEAVRARAEAVVGPAFDLAAFHYTVLAGGPRPLAQVERDLERWYEAQMIGG